MQKKERREKRSIFIKHYFIVNKKKARKKSGFFNKQITNYLFITYMVTSKPKRISVAAGLVHIIFLLKEKLKIKTWLNIMGNYIANYEKTNQ